MKRNFNDWFSTFRTSIATFDYYIDFSKVYENVNKMKIELNILNSLIGSKNIDKDFREILRKYPEVFKCLPILLAVRNNEIRVTLDNKLTNYNFKDFMSIDDYCFFMNKSGLYDLFSNHLINNVFDYVTGVEVGLDSNGRKNRGGHLMENLVERNIVDAGFVLDYTYFKQILLKDIEKKWNVDLSKLSNFGKTNKIFDFVIKTDNYIYAIETNFYSGNGSKLNETARSYKALAQESKDINNFKFVWITDGDWYGARHNLEETFDVLDDMYNIADMENGLFKHLK